MNNITHQFEDVYVPYKGLVVYKNKTDQPSDCFVESFDFSRKGRPINFHPLTDKESSSLAQVLYPSEEGKTFLHIRGIIPRSVLLINSSKRGYAIWCSAARKAPLFFKEQLGIPSGCGYVPPLIWKASREQLYIFALTNNKRPSPNTPLYHAPFFNINASGLVCMGNVMIKIDEHCSLDNFIVQWEKYFYSSYFSHLIIATSPVSGNIVQLWKQQIETGQKFPVDVLLKTQQSLKNIL